MHPNQNPKVHEGNILSPSRKRWPFGLNGLDVPFRSSGASSLGLNGFGPWLGHHSGGCQNNDPFWGTLNIRCRIRIGIQKGTIILTTPRLLAQPTFGLSSWEVAKLKILGMGGKHEHALARGRRKELAKVCAASSAVVHSSLLDLQSAMKLKLLSRPQTVSKWNEAPPEKQTGLTAIRTL